MSEYCTYFISGHIDLSAQDFDKYYISAIDRAIATGGHFVIGDAKGTDLMAQIYLANKRIPNERVTIYHMGRRVYNGNCSGYPTRGGFTTHEEKDAAMTAASGHDIAYVRDEQEQRRLYGNKYRKRMSGTEKNVKRRTEICPVCCKTT